MSFGAHHRWPSTGPRLCDECGEYFDAEEHHWCPDLEPITTSQKWHQIVPMEVMSEKRRAKLLREYEPPPVRRPMPRPVPTVGPAPPSYRYDPEPDVPLWPREGVHLLWWSMGALEIGVRANLALARENGPK